MTSLPRLQALSSRRRGFTLVELLVVMFIILVLAALTMVVTQKVLARSRQASAVQTLRQVAIAHIAYTEDHMGKINVIREAGDTREGRDGKNVSDSYWGRFTPYLFDDVELEQEEELKDYILNSLNGLFSTPDAERMDKTVIDGSPVYQDGSGLPIPMAFNSNLYLPNNDVSVNQLRDPGNVIYVTFGYGFFDEEDGSEFVERPREFGTPPDTNIYYMDNGEALVIFVDGRVGYVAPPMNPNRFE